MNGTTSVVVTLNLPRVTAVTVIDDTLSWIWKTGALLLCRLVGIRVLHMGHMQNVRMFRSQERGFGLHWPDLDEDIGIEGIMLGKKSNESPQSFEKW